MKNEITRKITSLTLLTIMLAGAVTFAVPGAMPAAEAAHNANLFVSAESSIFKNTFGGPMVVEIVINDPALTDTDEAKGEPDVTVNGKDVRMAQASDGLWYAYVADRTQAQRADQIIVDAGTPGVGLDFGTFCAAVGTTLDDGAQPVSAVFTDTVGLAVTGIPGGATGSQGTLEDPLTTACDGVFTASVVGDPDVNVVRENKLLNTNTVQTNGNGQLDLQEAAWPFIQLYDFNPTGSVEIKYNKGGGTQTTTLTFDTMDAYSKLTLDRTSYAVGSEVHIALTDGQLNIDPTDEDSWTFGTLATAPQTHYQVFDENGAATDETTESPNIVTKLASLMFEDNGVVKLAGNTQVANPSVVDLDANNDQAASPPAAFGFIDDDIAFSAITSDTAILDAGTQPVTFVETGANTGTLTNYDEDDDSNIDICSAVVCGYDALRGTSGAIDYNKKSTSIVVGFGFGSLAFAAPTNAVWNSGEEIAVTLVDTDANKNTRADEDLDLNNPAVALIPALRIGVPATLATGILEEASSTLDGTEFVDFNGDGFINALDGAANGVQLFSDRAMLELDEGSIVDGGDELELEFGTWADIYKASPINNPDYEGFTLLNYDVRSLANDGNAESITSVDIELEECPIAAAQPLSGHVTIDVDAFVICNGGLPAGTDTIDVDYVINSPASETIADGTVLPIVTDFFGFGLIGDGFKTLERINNSIYRFELEESGDNTSTFLGTAEFTMLNQLNIFDPVTYSIIRSIDDEVTFIVHEDLDDEDAPRISYLDLGSDGTSVQISAQEDAGTNSGIVAFDKESYKVADTVTITLTDADLNVDSDLIDIYVTVSPVLFPGDPAVDTVGKDDLGVYTDGSPRGRLMDVTFDDNKWTTLDPLCVGLVTPIDTGLSAAGFTLVETGSDTGVFKGDFAIPADYCPPTGPAESTTGLDLEVNYVDFRDASGEVIEVGDGAGIRANTGSVSFDRTVYPVPFGDIVAAGGDTGDSSPNGHSIFPIHLTGIGVLDVTDDIDSVGETL